MKTAVVTGASAGVGKASAAALLQQGWRVFGVGRDAARCAEAESTLAPLGDFAMLRADMASLRAVAGLAAEIAARTDRIDVLVNNAGGVTAERTTTPDGYEQTFAANHLAPFLLTKKLWPLVKDGGRVIAVSSTGHEMCNGIRWDDVMWSDAEYLSGGVYCQAKLANVLFTRELARRGAADGIVAHAMHPGVVASNFANHAEPGMQAYMDSIADQAVPPEVPAETIAFLATSDRAGECTGLYWHRCEAIDPAPQALDDAAAARLWALSEELVAGF